jgi:teichuronic acid biosynthesis glycosyltransferase TuaC
MHPCALEAHLMRVLVVTNMYPSETEPQFGAFVKDEVEDLRHLGIDVEVLFFDGRKSWTRYADAAREIRRLVRQDRFDLVHAHYGLCGAVALGQRCVPVVTTFHGSDVSGAIRWQAWISWLAARHSSPIFVSREGARRLRQANAPVIPAGVDIELFQPIDRAHARHKLGWSPGPRYVLFPSNPRAALKRADLFQAVLREAETHVPNLKAVYLEGYTREQVALVMNAVDVTLITSDWEGSPVTVRESLACQTPVVSVPVGDVPKTLAGLPGCRVAPRDPAALAGAVVAALEAGRPHELRRRAELSSRRRTAERVAQVYESTVRA